MAEVIDFSGRKKVRDDLEHTDQLESLKALLHCNYCAHRCARCGGHGEPTHLVTHAPRGLSFRLCSACRDDYLQLVRHLETGRPPDGPSWHNRQWVHLWLAWLEYQAGLARYLTSPEVIRILEELRKE